MNKKIILLSVLVLLSTVALSQVVYAANSTLSVTPATISRNVGTIFNIGVQVDPQGGKVCVVKGTLDFGNLSCQNIAVASGIMAVITPTCANPNFTLGIPTCTSISKNILNISMKGNQVGQSYLSFTGARVIGEGSNVSSVWYGGAYDITAVAVPVVEETAPQNIEQPAENQEIPVSTEQVDLENNIPTGVGIAGLSAITESVYFWPLLIIFAIIVVGYAIYYFVKRRKEK